MCQGRLRCRWRRWPGAWAVTFLVYHLAKVEGRTQVALMLLTGLALNALAGAAIGVLVYRATDEQLRAFIFWSLGSLTPGGLAADWRGGAVHRPVAGVVAATGAAAECAGAGRGRGAPPGRAGAAGEARVDFSVGDDGGRGGGGVRDDWFRGVGGAASGAAVVRAGPPAAAAGLGAARRGVAAGRRYGGAAAARRVSRNCPSAW